ncbi:hypothetical protein H2204_009433 [Knufia peltigerae]|uniref:Serine carboxypeptidase n=1 Tax=Knufia peltigerae TaxID=1002370 RepID=A0AA38XYZ6_9EURO|nr:hypothetical protein H2204_009433 [Knufia peltigerae]
MKTFSTLLGVAALPLTLAQFPPTPSGLTTITSTVNKDVKITWKETEICETTPGVKTYSGYVHLPGHLLADLGGYDMNTYFMYFEARHNPASAPLGIYLAGGPGEASTYAALSSESGPCYANLYGNDTVLNPWSFNNNVNMLYIDQPTQTGLSYSSLVNGTYDLASLNVTPENFTAASRPVVNGTFGYGTYSDQDPSTTANTTVAAGRALWRFAEHWFSSFPQYNTTSKSVGIWGNSYGGFWVPETAAQISKNLKNLTDTHPLKKKALKVDSIGITNGCMDFEYLMEGYLEFANNNTYGVKFLPQDIYDEAQTNLTKPGGCLDMIKQCRQAGNVGDAAYSAANATVNQICEDSFLYCSTIVSLVNELHNVSVFDVAIETPDQCNYYLPVAQYLNLPEVQSSLGLPLNWTWDSNVITALLGFVPDGPIPGTGDSSRQAGLVNLEYLLGDGVKVAMVFGDRDYRCPWTGGEATAKAASWKHQNGFVSTAGYQELQGLVSKNAKTGVVKQFGQLSFTRVFDSGHSVSAYAPEAVFRVFNRTTFGKDVVSGQKVVGDDYHTTGPTDSWGWRNKMPPPIQDTCMVEGKFLSVNPWAAVDGGQ